MTVLLDWQIKSDNLYSITVKGTVQNDPVLGMVCVAYLRLIIFLVVGDVFIDSETLLMADFVNLKIKST
jgi:hypothetical protein